MFSLTAWSQSSSDSTISIARWKVVRLAEIALRAQACDSIVIFQEKEIQAGLNLQVVSDSLLSNEQRQVVFAKAVANEQLNLYEGQKALTKIEIKKKRKWILATGVVVLVWIGREVLID